MILVQGRNNANPEFYRHKWFWDKSIETKGRKDTYRYRVIDQATDVTILPENEWYDPVEDDENKIKILFAGLAFKEHRKYISQTTLPVPFSKIHQTLTPSSSYTALAAHLP